MFTPAQDIFYFILFYFPARITAAFIQGSLTVNYSVMFAQINECTETSSGYKIQNK